MFGQFLKVEKLIIILINISWVNQIFQERAHTETYKDYLKNMNTKEDKIKFLVFSAAYPYRGGISDSTHSLCNEITKLWS